MLTHVHRAACQPTPCPWLLHILALIRDPTTTSDESVLTAERSEADLTVAVQRGDIPAVEKLLVTGSNSELNAEVDEPLTVLALRFGHDMCVTCILLSLH